MEFLNLSIGEFLAVAGVISAAVLALYLMDRSKRRQVVATMRFWTAGQTPEEMKRKRRIHQPWSLLLQLLSILLLLAAIAEPFWGNRNATRDHVLLLDTSAWMGARARQGNLLDQAKTAALAYLASLPASDRVMLVRADALPTPVTQFESNRSIVAAAIRQSQPSSSALNLEQAMEFAQRSQSLQGHTAGEIVFAGAGRIAQEDAELIVPPANLRMLAIPSIGENVGIRKLGLRRAAISLSASGTSNSANGAAQGDAWELFVALHNDGTRPREVSLELQFAGSAIGGKTITVPASAESRETFLFHAKTGGLVEARIRSTNGRADAFPQDDRASIDVPVSKHLRIAAYTNEPELLRALLGDKEHLDTAFAATSAYVPKPDADLVILDRFTPAAAPQVPSLWIQPPAGSPFNIRSTATKTKLQRWHEESPLAEGLHTTDLQLATAQIFSTAGDLQVIAETAEGPVVVARDAPLKTIALGFHPLQSAMKYDLATPLLMANIFRWMGPETFRRSDVQAGTVGTVTVPLEKDVKQESIRVLDANQRALPFTLENAAGNTQLRFFSGAPGNVRVRIGDRETVYALNLPAIGDLAWNPPANVARGIPRNGIAAASSPALWPWLALLGALGLLADWFLYGRKRIVRVNARTNLRAGEAAFGSKTWRKAS